MGDPKTFTVEAGKTIEEQWPQGSDFAVYGPNGFFRSFAGSGRLAVSAQYDEARSQVALVLTNTGSEPLRVSVSTATASRPPRSTSPPAVRRAASSLRTAGGWYDLTVTVQRVPDFKVKYAGHVENGRPSISDPLMGGVV